jgi:hypothetical protein
MKTNEPTEQTLDTLLRTPLDVPDDGFSAAVVSSIARQRPGTWPLAGEMLWPAWLLALAGAIIALPWERTAHWLASLSQQWNAWLLQTQALSHPLWAQTEQWSTTMAGWLPVMLALGLLWMLMALVED